MNTNTIIWSENLCRLHGIEPQDFDGKYETVLNLIHPDDREYVSKRTQDWLAAKRPMLFEYRIITPDHVVKTVQGTNQIILDQDGNIVETLGLIQDISKRKQADRTACKSATTARTGSSFSRT